jgi:hypothetical protein
MTETYEIYFTISIYYNNLTLILSSFQFVLREFGVNEISLTVTIV